MLIDILFIAALTIWLGTFLTLVLTSEVMPLFMKVCFLLFSLFLTANAITVLIGL